MTTNHTNGQESLREAAEERITRAISCLGDYVNMAEGEGASCEAAEAHECIAQLQELQRQSATYAAEQLTAPTDATERDGGELDDLRGRLEGAAKLLETSEKACRIWIEKAKSRQEQIEFLQAQVDALSGHPPHPPPLNSPPSVSDRSENIWSHAKQNPQLSPP